MPEGRSTRRKPHELSELGEENPLEAENCAAVRPRSSSGVYRDVARATRLRGLAFAVCAVGLPACYQGWEGLPADVGIRYETVLELEVGEQGITYGNRDAPELVTWGPTALDAEGDTIWIADAARSRVRAYDRPTRTWVEDVELDALTQRIADVEAIDGTLYVLDNAGDVELLRVSADGSVAIVELPPGVAQLGGVRGLAEDQDGSLLFVLDGADPFMRVLSPQGELDLTPLSGLSIDGARVTGTAADLSNDPRRGVVSLGGFVVDEITVGASLTGVEPIGVWSDGRFAVSVREMAVADGELVLDETVRVYDAEGTFLREARLDSPAEALYVDNRFALTPDGGVLALSTREDRVEVRQLEFSSAGLPRVLPPSPVLFAENDGSGPILDNDDHVPGSCRSGGSMHLEALRYASVHLQYSEDNVAGECTSRGAPGWASSPGSYTGVAYDWAGFDSLDEYEAQLSWGLQAGDISPSGEGQTCSRGVDCGGFVSRVWGLDARETSATLRGIAGVVGNNEIMTGDIADRPGEHVRMFLGGGPGASWLVAEAITAGLDRVVIRQLPPAALAGYELRRYDEHCGFYKSPLHPEGPNEADEDDEGGEEEGMGEEGGEEEGGEEGGGEEGGMGEGGDGGEEPTCSNECWPEYVQGTSCDPDLGTVRCEKDQEGCWQLTIVNGCQASDACYGAPGTATCCEGAFCDDDNNPHEAAIDHVAAEGVTTGCGQGPGGEPEFCPDATATRAESLAMVLRAAGIQPVDSPDGFDDDDGHWAEGYANAAKLHGITNGVSPGVFAPDEPSTRSMTAAFLARAYDLPAPSNDYFTDDDHLPGWAQTAHNQLFEAGLTIGCSQGNFCGEDPMRRDHLAVFLSRAFENGL